MEIAKPVAASARLDAKSSSEAIGWRTALASSFGLSIGPSVMTILGFGAFISPLGREFGWSVPAIAVGASIISIMIMVLSPIQGALVDRFGGRRVVLLSIPFFGLSLCMMYFLPNNIWVFYAAWVIIPACGLGVWPISYLRSTAGWFDRKLGLALGVTNAGIGVGSMLVPLLTAYLIANYGWREAYLGLGLIALVAWPVAYLFLTDPQPQLGGVSLTGDTLREASRTRPFWLATAGFFLLGLFTTGLIVHQVRIFIDAGIPPATATAIPAAFGFALIIGRLGTGWLLDRISAAKIMGFLMACGVVATLIFTGRPDVSLAIFAAVLVGLITGAEFDVLSYIIPRYNGRRSFGQIYGAIFAVFQLGGAIGIYAIGAVRGATGSYALAMYGLMAICIAAGLLFTLLGPYRFRPGEHA